MYIPMMFPGGTVGGGDEESTGFSFFTGLTPAVTAKGIIAKISEQKGSYLISIPNLEF